MYRFLQTGSIKSGRVNIDLQPGKFAALLLKVYGTTDSGETLTLADVGQIRIKRGGEEVISESFKHFHHYNDLKGGYIPTVSGNAASAENVEALIPFSLPNFRSVMDVRSVEEVDVILDFDTVLATRFGSNAAVFELYGIEVPDVSEAYQLMIIEQDIAGAGAGRVNQSLNGENTAVFYFQDDSDKVDEVKLLVDGNVVVDSIDQDVLQEMTSYLNRIESAGNPLAEVPLVSGGKLQSAINKGAHLEATFNGAGTLKVTMYQIRWYNR